MEKRSTQLIVLLLFAVFLCAPMIQQRLALIPMPLLNENRNRAARPRDVASLWTGKGDFASRFETFFDDHYGFRDFLIRTKNQLDFSLFKKSDQILVGKNGYLFYKSVVEKDQVEIERHSEADFQRVLLRLNHLGERLEKRGIQLILAPMPLKNSVYPETLPPSAPRRPSPTGFQRFGAMLRVQPHLTYFDTYSRLMGLSASMPIFHKTDFHWNDAAGGKVAIEFVNALARLSGFENIWNHDLGIHTETMAQGGGQTNAMALLWPSGEDSLFVRVSEPVSKGLLVGVPNKSNEWRYTAPQGLPGHRISKTVLFGDSFADAFSRSGFQRYFDDLQKYYIKDFRENYPRIPEGTRFVVLEFIETDLKSLFADSFWPDAILNQRN